MAWVLFLFGTKTRAHVCPRERVCRCVWNPGLSDSAGGVVRPAAPTLPSDLKVARGLPPPVVLTLHGKGTEDPRSNTRTKTC